jgi:hypothetical protein
VSRSDLAELRAAYLRELLPAMVRAAHDPARVQEDAERLADLMAMDALRREENAASRARLEARYRGVAALHREVD